MSMALTPLALTMVTQTCSWNGSMSTTMRPQVKQIVYSDFLGRTVFPGSNVSDHAVFNCVSKGNSFL